MITHGSHSVGRTVSKQVATAVKQSLVSTVDGSAGFSSVVFDGNTYRQLKKSKLQGVGYCWLTLECV